MSHTPKLSFLWYAIPCHGGLTVHCRTSARVDRNRHHLELTWDISKDLPLHFIDWHYLIHTMTRDSLNEWAETFPRYFK